MWKLFCQGSGRVSFLVFSLLLAAPAWAGIDFKVLRINDYDVYLINTHFGNGVALTANVQTGSWHDDPVRQAGRAHLFEHWIFEGSKKYPGHGTFNSRMSRVGGQNNAYTALTRTFFHWLGHPDGFDEAADNIGAMLSAPQFDAEAYARELATVKNEVAEYQKRDDMALSVGLYYHLLPAGHPLKMYYLGTQAQLDAMDPNDLRALYFANYVPGSMQIIVAGNFDPQADGRPAITEERVRAAIAANFIPPRTRAQLALAGADPNIAASKHFPSLLGADRSAPRVVELGTPSDRYLLKLAFEVTDEVHPGVLETLTDYLNLTGRGSLSDELQRKGWIVGIGVGGEEVNNLKLLSVHFSLTKEGAARRDEVVAAFFSALRDVRTNGVRPEVLVYLRGRNVLGYAADLRNPRKAAEHLAKFLDSGLPVGEAFDFSRVYGAVTSEQMQQVARVAFPLDRMLVSYVGPDVTSERRDDLFARPVRFPDASEKMRLWATALERGTGLGNLSRTLETPRVPFRTSERPMDRPSRPGRLLAVARDGVRLAFKEDHRTATGAAALAVRFEASSPERGMAGRLYSVAFEIRHRTELDFLRTQGFEIDADISQTTLALIAAGNSGAVPDILRWLNDAFFTYEPTEEELVGAREQLLAGHRRKADDFTAMAATRGMAPLLASSVHVSEDEQVAALERLPLDRVLSEVRALFARAARLDVGVAGDFDEATARQLAASTLLRLPGNGAQLGRITPASDRYPSLRQSIALWQPLAATKAEDQFGWARAFPGPAAGTRDHAALSILRHVLGEAIFQHNRGERKLGYVHNVSLQVTPAGVRPMLYGQTDGRDRLPEIDAGWAHVIARLANGTLSADGFAGARQAMLRNELLLPYRDSYAASLLLSDLRLAGDITATERYEAALPLVTTEEIYDAGRRYLIGTPTIDVVAARAPVEGLVCGPLILSAAEARTRLAE